MAYSLKLAADPKKEKAPILQQELFYIK